MEKEETASPTTALESVLLTAVIDAKEGRDVATVDIKNAFIQTKIPQEEGKERIILKIRGKLVNTNHSLHTSAMTKYYIAT